MGEKILPEANVRRAQLTEDISAEKDAASRGIVVRDRDLHRDLYFFGRDHFVYRFEEFQTNPPMTRGIVRLKTGANRITERVEAESMLYSNGRWSFIKGSTRSFTQDSGAIALFDTLVDLSLTATPEDMVKRIKSIEEMSYWELADAIDKARMRGEKVEKFLADLYFKTALPFMNFIVILLGISITVRAGRKGAAVLFGMGLLLTFTYWVISQAGLALGHDGRIDPLLAAWGGNIVFALLGAVLYRQASR
jgi:lipopolysaccharide export LptBFGC system permease protein LptF